MLNGEYVITDNMAMGQEKPQRERVLRIQADHQIK